VADKPRAWTEREIRQDDVKRYADHLQRELTALVRDVNDNYLISRDQQQQMVLYFGQLLMAMGEVIQTERRESERKGRKK